MTQPLHERIRLAMYDWTNKTGHYPTAMYIGHRDFNELACGIGLNFYGSSHISVINDPGFTGVKVYLLRDHAHHLGFSVE